MQLETVMAKGITMKYLSTYLTIIALCSLLGVDGNAMKPGKREADGRTSSRPQKRRKLEDREEIKNLLMKAYTLCKQFQGHQGDLKSRLKFVQDRAEEGYLETSFIAKLALAQERIIKAVLRVGLPLGETHPYEEYLTYFPFGTYSTLNLPETLEEWEKYIEEFEIGIFKNFGRNNCFEGVGFF